jgi:hypothetical protein
VLLQEFDKPGVQSLYQGLQGRQDGLVMYFRRFVWTDCTNNDCELISKKIVGERTCWRRSRMCVPRLSYHVDEAFLSGG